MKNQTAIRPPLSKTLASSTFQSFYYEKKELVDFCLQNNIPIQGGKLELSKRIAHFLDTSEIQDFVRVKRVGAWDSQQTISSSTKVINYKNDAQTKTFFTSQLGSKFKFNDYLRQFAKKSDMDGSLTYADLVNGWLRSQADKKTNAQKTPIAKQFQFNQFQRDFYAAEKAKTRQQFLDAWRLVRSVAGPVTYAHYLTLLKPKVNVNEKLELYKLNVEKNNEASI